MIRRYALVIAALLVLPTQALAYTNSDVIRGFNATVFGSEYTTRLFSSTYVRKFPGLVRMHVSSYSPQRRREVERFALSLNKLIDGVRIVLVRNPRTANFRIHIVPQSRYAITVQRDVYRDRNATVRGKCLVRAQYTENGIWRSDAVIVGDGSDRLFSRCMTEEILQGLGPLNDDASLVDSMFNDQSTYTVFRRYDRLILNMLYDRRIRPGMSPTDVAPLLPTILRDTRRRIEKR